MEAKKTPAADLERKSLLFFSIGLITSLIIVGIAFEWRQRVSPFDLARIDTGPAMLLIEIPVTEILPPKAPSLPRTVVIKEVEDDPRLETVTPIMDMESLDTTQYVAQEIPDLVPEESDFIVCFAEESAAPKGGLQAFYKYVSDKIKYPPQARRMGIEGRVYVEFVISKDGSLTDVKAIKGIGAGCDEEAVRIVQSAPAWNPGKQRGKPVRQRYTLPIIFKLG